MTAATQRTVMVDLQTLDDLQIPPPSQEAIRSELAANGLSEGLLRIGRLNASPSEWFLLWTHAGHAPVTMVVDSERLEDVARASLVAQDFFVHWKRENLRHSSSRRAERHSANDVETLS